MKNMWVYVYDVETKRQSSQWMGKGSPRGGDELVKDQYDVRCVFCLERHCPP